MAGIGALAGMIQAAAAGTIRGRHRLRFSDTVHPKGEKGENTFAELPYWNQRNNQILSE